MAYRAGSAFIEIAPSFRGFQIAAAREAKKLRAIKIPVEYDMPALPATAPGKPVKVKAEFDGGSFQRDLKSKVASALASLPKNIGLGADATEAEREIASLRTQLELLSKQEIGVDVSAESALAEIEYVRAELERLGAESGSVQVRADAGQAVAQLAAVQAGVSALDGQSVSINVKTKGVQFAFRGISNMTTAIASFGSTAVPILATVGAGVGVLGSTFLTAGAAGGALGGVVAGNIYEFTKLKEAIKEQAKMGDSANKAVDAARASLAGATKGTASYESAQVRLTEALRNQRNQQAAAAELNKKLTSDFGPLQKGIDRITVGYGKLADATRPKVVGLMGSALSTVAGILPRLAPLVNATATAVQGLVDDFAKFTVSRQFDRLLDTFRIYGPAAIGTLGRSVGNLFGGIVNLFVKFAPYQSGFLDWIEDASRRFSKWSGSMSATNGVSKFMGYIKRVGPDVALLFQSLAEFVGKFIVALGPLAGVQLKILTGIFTTLNKLPKEALTGIAFGITAVVIGLKAWEIRTKAVAIAQAVAAGATKAWAFAQKLLNLAMKANPIGLLIVGLTLLGAGLVLAYKKSETFRRIVDGAWAGIKKAVSSAWNGTIKPVLKAFGAYIAGTVMPIVRRLWTNVVKPTFGDIGRFIGSVWRNVVKPIFGAYKTYLTNVLFPVLRFLWERVVKPVFGGLGRTIGNTWRNVVKPVFGAMREGVDKVRSAFRTAVDRIRDIWSELKGATKAPVRFIIETVMNNGLFKAIGKIPGLKAPHIDLPKGWATGGWTGPGDRMQPAGIVHADEFVIRKDSRRRIERAAPGLLDRLNRDGDRPLHAPLPRLPGYWIGGGVKPAAGSVSQHSRSQYPWAAWAGDINEPGGMDMGKPVRAWKAGVIASIKRLTTSYGHHIRVNHSGQQSLYAHLSRIGVGVGQAVKAGQIIGGKGSTGKSSGPHLHFEFTGGSAAMGGDRRGGSPGGSGDDAGYTTVKKYPNFTNPLTAIRDKVSGWASRLSDMGGMGKLMSKVPGAVLDKVSSAGSFVMKKITSALNAVRRVVSNVRTALGPRGSDGLVPLMSAAKSYALNKWGPMSIGGYAYRANTANPSQMSDHAYGKALDLHGGGDMPAIARYFAGAAGRNRFKIENVIYNRQITNPGRGWRWGPYGGPNPHTDHVHIDTFDRGGYLPPGLSTVYNGTGKPEPVLTSNDWASIRKLANVGDKDTRRGLTVNYNAPVYTHDPDELARKVDRRNRAALAIAATP